MQQEVNNGDLRIFNNPKVSSHSPRRSIVTYLTSIWVLDRHTSVQWVSTVIGWVRGKYYCAILGMWVILRDKLGTVNAKHFYYSFQYLIRKFVSNIRLYLECFTEKSIWQRMQLHMFILVSPKKFPACQDLMPFKDHDLYNFRITRTLRCMKQELFNL